MISRLSSPKVFFLCCWFLPGLIYATDYSQVQKRIDLDVQAGKPIVVHIVVALADNLYQGIVPTSLSLGNGQNSRTNLYWGAMYGVGSFFSRQAGWTRVRYAFTKSKKILDKIILKKIIKRSGKNVTVYIIAEAWNGKYIKDAIQYYYGLLSGNHDQEIRLNKSKGTKISVGGAAHMNVYIGHNGLMDFSIKDVPKLKTNSKLKSAVILACKSKSYFSPVLKKLKANSLILTTGLMAPEAYTLDASIKAWVEGKSAKQVHQAAARAYQKYQKNNLRASQRLFYTDFK